MSGKTIDIGLWIDDFPFRSSDSQEIGLSRNQTLKMTIEEGATYLNKFEIWKESKSKYVKLGFKTNNPTISFHVLCDYEKLLESLTDLNK